MKQRIFSHFQDYLIQYISHQYQDLLYCNSSQYILSTYSSQHNNNNNVVLAMTMPYSGQDWRHSALNFPSGRALCLQPWPLYWHSHCKHNIIIKILFCWKEACPFDIFKLSFNVYIMDTNRNWNDNHLRHNFD